MPIARDCDHPRLTLWELAGDVRSSARLMMAGDPSPASLRLLRATEELIRAALAYADERPELLVLQ